MSLALAGGFFTTEPPEKPPGILNGGPKSHSVWMDVGHIVMPGVMGYPSLAEPRLLGNGR